MASAIDLAAKAKIQNNTYVSLREEKKKRLKEEQASLRAFKPTTENLKRQQEVLRTALLIRKPEHEIRKEKILRIKEQEKLNKDISFRMKKQKELDEKLKRQFNIKSEGMFFPYSDVRMKMVTKIPEKKGLNKRLKNLFK